MNCKICLNLQWYIIGVTFLSVSIFLIKKCNYTSFKSGFDETKTADEENDPSSRQGFKEGDEEKDNMKRNVPEKCRRIPSLQTQNREIRGAGIHW